MRDEYFDLQKKGIEVLVVGPDSVDKFRAYWEKEGLPFPGLPDPKHKVLKLLGQEIKLFKLGRMPAQMLIDKKGLVRYGHYGNSMEDIPSSKEVIKVLGGEEADMR